MNLIWAIYILGGLLLLHAFIRMFIIIKSHNDRLKKAGLVPLATDSVQTAAKVSLYSGASGAFGHSFNLFILLGLIAVTIFLLSGYPALNWGWPSWTVFVLPGAAFFGFIWYLSKKLWVAFVVSAFITGLILMTIEG